MSRETKLIRTAEGVARLAAELYGVTASIAPCTAEPNSCTVGALDDNAATSVGAHVWLKARLCEQGVFSCPPPDEPDDVPIVFAGPRRKYAALCPVARSKMFRTMQVVYPIDLTTLKVARGW